MLTAQLTGLRQFTLIEESLPDPGPGEVQVRVAATGLCGSDMHSYAEGGIAGTPCQYPMVLGHEPSGIIVKTGPGVTGFSPGDKGALEPAIFCYHCEFCLRGLHNLCAHLRFMSTPAEPGFFREYVNIPAHNFLPCGAGLTVEEASLMEPIAIVLHTLLLGSFRAGESALVIGAGPIGLLTVAALKLAGARRVWVSEPVGHRRDMAKAIGADAVLDPGQSEPAAAFAPMDIAFDCAAKEDSVNQCINAVKPAGRVVITGIHAHSHISLDANQIRRNEITVFGVRRSNNESPAALDLLEEHAKLFVPVITHKRKLQDINQAFELNETYSDGVGKLLIV